MNDAGVLDGDVRFCLVLPREALSVPVMRRVLGGTLLGFGADEECVADILLAASEACTNVLKHGDRSGEYEVSASVARDAFLLEIANGPSPHGAVRRLRPGRRPFSARALRARTFGARAHGWARAGVRAEANGSGALAAPVPADDVRASTAEGQAGEDARLLQESGRGLTIMRACMDDLTLRGAPGRGTVVSMRKQITWAPAATGRHADASGSGHTAGLRLAG